MKTHPGSCHCGDIRFSVKLEAVELTTCDCSLCIKRNAVMTKVPEAALQILWGEERLSLYQWNSMRAQHFFCSRCGIYVFHRKRAAPHHFGVNVFCLDGFDHESFPIQRTEGAVMTLVCPQPRAVWPGPSALREVDEQPT